MGVFCDRLKLCSTDCWTGQNNGRYHKQELSFLLVLLALIMYILHSDSQFLTEMFPTESLWFSAAHSQCKVSFNSLFETSPMLLKTSFVNINTVGAATATIKMQFSKIFDR